MNVSRSIVSFHENYYSLGFVDDQGSFKVWGDGERGANPGPKKFFLSKNVSKVVSKAGAYAALLNDGKIISWGNPNELKAPINYESEMANLKFKDVVAGSEMFVGITEAGSVYEWGYRPVGTDVDLPEDLAEVVSVTSTSGAFAALRSDGTVVSWGKSSEGGDSSLVSTDLINVVKIFSTGYAFAALKSDGTVVSWGASSNGGDSSTVSSALTNVTKIYSNHWSFAALKSDGTVVTWGNSNLGGDSSGATGSLTDVSDIISNDYAYAAIKNDASVVVWGDLDRGGGLTAGENTLLSSGVVQVYSVSDAFAALKNDGTVVSWGYGDRGDSSAVAVDLVNITNIFTTTKCFIAKNSLGGLVAWGDVSKSCDLSSVSTEVSSDVDRVFGHSNGSYVAVKSDNSIVTWGAARYGGNHKALVGINGNVKAAFDNGSAIAVLSNDGAVDVFGSPTQGGSLGGLASTSLASGVVSIFYNSSSFAALKEDGSVVTWGDARYGGDSSAVAPELNSGVVEIYSNNQSYFAVESDGSVVTWGTNSSTIAPIKSQLESGFTSLVANQVAFSALMPDGSVLSWGDPDLGGSQGAKASSLASGVSKVYAAGGSFAALKADGSVVTWGLGGGGDSSAVASQLTSDVVEIFPNVSSVSVDAYTALKIDGSIVAWGDSTLISSWESVGNLANYRDIKALNFGVRSTDNKGYLAIDSNGEVHAWGNNSFRTHGFTSVLNDPKFEAVVAANSENPLLKTFNDNRYVRSRRWTSRGGCTNFYTDPSEKSWSAFQSNDTAYALLDSNGKLTTIGSACSGYLSPVSMTSMGLDVKINRIYSSTNSFLAITEAGRVLIWGGYRLDSPIDLNYRVLDVEGLGSSFIIKTTENTFITGGPVPLPEYE